MANRPRQRTEVVRVRNRGPQLISLQIKPPQGDFYIHEQQVHIKPGKSAMVPKNYLRMDQVNNLAARGLLQVTYDSESAASAD